MPQTHVLVPDPTFVDAIVASGGGDLKKCFQCATCSAVCGLSKGDHPFPRKEMHWAQWGLKDRLVSDPDIWLCYQCNDCSQRCPRGARPGDVLAAIRHQTIQHFAFPGVFVRWLSSLRGMPVALVLLPALLLALALVARDPIESALGIQSHDDAFYAAFFPHWLLIGFFTTLTTLTFIGLVVGLVRFWRGMRAADASNAGDTPVLGILAAVAAALGAVFSHARFTECTDRVGRRSAHLLAFYGFLALFVVTVWAVIDLYVMPVLGQAALYPFDLTHPMKLVGNAGGVALVAGSGKAILDRTKAPDDGRHESTSFDWVFLWLLLLAGVTGFVVESFRFAAGEAPGPAFEATAYGTYFVHLVLVFGLLVYLPYSKFAHMWYRLLALTYAARTGRLNGDRAVVAVEDAASTGR